MNSIVILNDLQNILIRATEEVIVNPYQVKEVPVQDNSTNLILISVIVVLVLWIVTEKISSKSSGTVTVLKNEKSLDRLKDLMEEKDFSKTEDKEEKFEKAVKVDEIKDKNILTQYQEGTGSGITEIEEQLKQDPDNLDLLDWLAFAYYSNNRLNDAEQSYLKILELKEDSPSHHYYLGNTYFKLENYTKASIHWKTVISLKPGSKIARKAEDKLQKMKG